MNLTEFIQRFPDEQSCRLHLKNRRETHGIVCKKCGCTHHYWLQNKWMWQCSKCNFRTTLKAGTMFENSNLPIRIWYLAIAFMCFSKKAVSACELQRQLKHSRYDTIWSLMHRIRNIMGNREAMYYLQDITDLTGIEDLYIIATPDRIRLRRRKKFKRIVNLLVGPTSVKDSEWTTEDNAKSARYQLRVCPICPGTGIKKKTQQKNKEKEIVFTDNTGKRHELSEIIEVLSYTSSGRTKNHQPKWKQVLISNVFRVLSGIYHRVKLKYLQLYLDEFCYKLNRRYNREQLFEKMVIASILHPVLA